MVEAADRFWRFSLNRYGRQGLAPLCLSLQDNNGADVNLLLFCLWCGQEGLGLSLAQIEDTDRHVLAWREAVVKPLRAVRRVLKTPPPGPDPDSTEKLREALKRVEIESERLQQVAIAKEAERSLPGSRKQPRFEAREAARANLSAYANTLAQGSSEIPGHILDELVRIAID